MHDYQVVAAVAEFLVGVADWQDVFLVVPGELGEVEMGLVLEGLHQLFVCLVGGEENLAVVL